MIGVLIRHQSSSKGKRNIPGLKYHAIDSLIGKLDATEATEERNALGEEIMHKLQEKGAIILLAPCLEYILSNLYISPSSGVNSLTDFIRSLPDMCVKRGKT